MLASLAEQKPQFPQPLPKRIFRRHRAVSTTIVEVSIGVSLPLSSTCVDVPQALASHHSLLSLATRTNRSQAQHNPEPRALNLWPARYRETTSSSYSHDTRQPFSPLNPPSLNRAFERIKEGRRSHVVSPGLPHLQHLPALLSLRTNTSKCPSTSKHDRGARWLRRLLE